MTLSLPQHLSSVAQARALVTTLLDVLGVSEETRDQLGVVITEASANAVQHGDASGTIDLTVAIDNDVCVIEVGNRGRSPGRGKLLATPPDPSQLNGRGLPLIAAMSDMAEFLAAPPGRVVLRATRTLTVRDRILPAQ